MTARLVRSQGGFRMEPVKRSSAKPKSILEISSKAKTRAQNDTGKPFDFDLLPENRAKWITISDERKGKRTAEE